MPREPDPFAPLRPALAYAEVALLALEQAKPQAAVEGLDLALLALPEGYPETGRMLRQLRERAEKRLVRADRAKGAR